jgi:hypothetical protein
MRVYVYYNLHKKVLSVKALEGPEKGRVIHHATMVVLEGCTFKVSEAGRQRVLREQRKNVHAGVVGTLVAVTGEKAYFPYMRSTEVTYNPYKYETFVYKYNEKPISKCDRVLMSALTRPVVRAA